MPTPSPPSRRISAGRVWEVVAALSLLSVLPLPSQAHRRPSALTVAGFGAVGLALGGMVSGVDVLLSPVLSHPVRSAVDLVLLAVASGAIHLDGLVDSADGLFGAADREGRLAVMRDSSAGSFGVAAVVLTILVEWASLGALAGERVGAIVVAVGVSRAAAGLALVWPPARTDGLGATYAMPRHRTGAVVGALPCVAIAGALCGPRGLLAAATGVLVAGGVGALFHRRVGGMTGDGCGAAGELALAAGLAVLGARS